MNGMNDLLAKFDAVEVKSVKIRRALLPKKPDYGAEEEDIAAYREKMEDLMLRYQDILDLIFQQTDGRSFPEQAMYELKKDTIRFLSDFSRYIFRHRGWQDPDWQLKDKMKAVMSGVGHYETGRYKNFPRDVEDLLSMKYQYFPVPCDPALRAALNEKVLYLIDSGTEAEYGISDEELFNAYTGDGGLHGLKRADYENYHEYSEAKKEIENGQFFTPPDICQLVCEALAPSVSDLVADLTCGKGSLVLVYK